MDKPIAPPNRILLEHSHKDVTRLVHPRKVVAYEQYKNPDYELPALTWWEKFWHSNIIDWTFYKK